MNSNNVWNEKQIEAYAAAFREGDALRMYGDWFEVKLLKDEVVKDGHDAIDLPTDEIGFKLNFREENSIIFNGIVEGFVTDSFDYYEVVSTFDYNAQEGDKLIWVGKTGKDTVGTEGKERFLTFGKSYRVYKDEIGLYYKDDNFSKRTLEDLCFDRWEWLIIPAFQNVKQEKTRVKSESYFDSERISKGDIVLVDLPVPNSIDDTFRVSAVVGAIDRTISPYKYQVFPEFKDKPTWVEGKNLKLVMEKSVYNCIQVLISGKPTLQRE